MKNADEIIKNIDWSELRNQKRTLLNVITELNTFTGFAEINEKQKKVDDLNGILYLIDAIQDYAVDDLGIVDSIHVYDFDEEENRED